METISNYLSRVFFLSPEKRPPTKALSTLPFQQDHLICSPQFSKYKTIKKVSDRFGGICELICNYVLSKDLLGKGKDSSFLQRRITLPSLNEGKTPKSHILDVYPSYWKISAFFFRVYPDNILSTFEQRKLVQGAEINSNQLKKALLKVDSGKTLKVEIIDKYFGGHSLLLKKVSDKIYALFDPNTGEHRNLSFSDVKLRLNGLFRIHQGADLLLLKGDSFLKRISFLKTLQD